MDKAIDTTAKALATLSHHVGSGKDQSPSKSFQTLIKMIGEAKTKHEEDRIIRKESHSLKERIGAADITPRQMRELLIRMIYCEMLGVECSWGYIHAIKMTQSSSFMDKRTGYLAASLFLHQNHELNMLLVNTIQRDLKSSNILLVSMALITICKLIGVEMIPPLLPLVQEKLLHPKELVRKKAVMVMQHFYSLSSSTVSHLEDDFRRSISDQDPGVMEAALILFQDMVNDTPHKFKDLVPSFTSILSQVVARKLPADFDYHGVPAPWIQIRLLRILSILGVDDLKMSELIYPVIEDVLASAECNTNIGQAISYECIRTITSIYPNSALIERAAKMIGRFMTASNNNWRYLGINALASLVQISSKYAVEHQLVVIDCLDDPDDTLKRKTLDLLYKMTNPSNVVVIADRLIAYLRATKDEYIRSDLVAKITQLAERFAPDNVWFIQTMNAVFELGGSLVRKEVAHNLMRLIAEGTDDDETDLELRLDAVNAYLDLIDKPHLPDILVKIICWVIGEYGYLAEEVGAEAILEKVTPLLGSRFEEEDTYGWVVTAVTKLVAQLGHMPESVQSLVAVHLTSTSTDVQQRCSELVELSQDMSVMQDVLPVDASCEDLEVDSSLSFLDGFVSESLAKGASAYKPAHLRDPISTQPKIPAQGPQSAGIKFQPYELPQAAPPPSPLYSRTAAAATAKANTPPSQHRGGREDQDSAYQQPQASPLMPSKAASGAGEFTYTPKEEGLAVKERKWGRTGYNKVATPTTGYSSQATATTDREREDYPDSSPAAAPPPDSAHDERATHDATGAALNPVQASILPPSEEEVKRKQLANQLFGGLSGPSRAPRQKQQRKSGSLGDRDGGVKVRLSPTLAGGQADKERGVVATSRAPARSTEPPVADLLLDLQDVDFSTPAPPPLSSNLTGLAPPITTTTRPTPTPTMGPASTGLLANLDVRNNMTQQPIQQPSPLPPAPAPIPAPAQTNLLDLDTPLVDTTPISSAATLGISSLHPELSTLDSDPVQSQQLSRQPALALTLFETPIGSVRVPQEYSKYPVLKDCENKELCQDANVRVTLTKVLKDDELVFVVFLTNQKQDSLSGVTLTVTPPTTMKLSQGSQVNFATDLGGFGNTCHTFSMVPSSPTINASVHGELAYKDQMASTRRLFFDISLSVTESIRPLKIKTPEFGKKWGTLTYEKKLKLSPSSIKTPDRFMEAIKSLNFHPVEIIGSEGIAAGSFLPSTLCLLHGKVLKTHVEFWVRTPSNLLTDAIAKIAQTALK